ncbi:MAG: hypothetical protein H6555_04455 [Lewinellaceae bacterium]|nr:hypothetical protein [Lewinellaceae bacterium]
MTFLFEVYPVPAFIRAVWFNWTYRSWQEFNWQTRIREGDPQVVSGLDNPGFRLYFHLASGGNAARTPGVAWELSPRANAFFIQAPAHFSPMQAFWFAVLQTEHFRAAEIEERWGGVVPIPSRMSQVSYWRLVFRKLRMEKCLPGYLRVKRVFDQLELIVFGQGELASISALLPLAGTGLPAPLSWYSWRTLELHLQERIVAVNRSQPFYAPPGIPEWAEVLSPRSGRKYVVIRLGTITQLLEEGVAMNHCLGLEHLYEAQHGVTSFWSVREHIGKGQEVSKLTFTLEEHRVTEIQGEQNGEPSDEALEVLWTWQFQMLVPTELVG